MSNLSGYLPEEIAAILRTQVHDKDALDKANNWCIAELLNPTPNFSRWEMGVYIEALKMLERRIQQAYKSLAISDEVASSGDAVRVFTPMTQSSARRRRKFNDGCDNDFPEPQTLEDLVIDRCGEDSDEWQQFLRLKGLFGVPKPVELKVVDDDLYDSSGCAERSERIEHSDNQGNDTESLSHAGTDSAASGLPIVVSGEV